MSQLVITPTFLSKAEMSSLRHRSVRFLLVVGLVWAALLGLLVITPPADANGFPTWSFAGLVAFAGIGLLQYCLLHAAHEASHHDFHPMSRTRLPVAILVAYPIGLTLSFRNEHLAHHRHLGDPELDADFAVYEPFPESKYAFLRSLVLNFSGLTAISHALGRAGNRTVQTPWHDHAALVGVQLALILCFTLTLGTVNYFIYWLLPLLTIVKGLAQLRGLAEHGSPHPDGGATLRTFLGRGIGCRLLGVFGFRHHAEHHLYPMVPFENLDKVRARMLQAAAPSSARQVVIEPYQGGHIQFLWQAFRALPWSAPPAAPQTTA